MSEHPTIQHLPHPRATSAAWLVMPPLHEIFVRVGQELMERRVEQPDRYRQPLHFPEYTKEVLFLERAEFCERLLPSLECLGEDHLPDGPDPVRSEEHMLCSAETYTFRAELECCPAVL